MERKYLSYIARLDLKAYEYKILLMLLEKPYTQMNISVEIGIARQNVNKYIASLKRQGLLEVDRVEGRNKYYRPVTDMKKLVDIMPGQIKI